MIDRIDLLSQTALNGQSAIATLAAILTAL
jgi:hypothetical protein